MEARKPRNLPKYAQICLEKLADAGLGNKISLGGALGLMLYHEYRSTFDVDAWWQPGTSTEERQQIITALEEVLLPFGQVRIRTWGDVVSVELQPDRGRLFSFQIAHRSGQLEPSINSPWDGLLLDSFNDLIAAKMVALVERGAPRDFIDVYTLCQEGLTDPAQCWALWRQRQALANSDQDPARARIAVQTHLARIEGHRPLASIDDPASRTNAEQLRTWFKEELINAL